MCWVANLFQGVGGMTITRQHLVLSLFQNRIGGALVRGHSILRSEQIALDDTPWQQVWTDGLTSLDQPLRQLLARLGVKGRPTVRVLYQSPSSQVQTFEIAGRLADARAAGEAKMRQVVPAGHAVSVGAVTPTLGKPGTWTVVGVSDREDHANAIYAWVYRCAGDMVGCLPCQAAVVQAGILRATESDADAAHCVIAENWSAIVNGNRSGINLVRTFELGYRSLTDVFLRALSSDSNMTRDEAERSLFIIGIPFKSREVDAKLRARVLPLVSPVMQRLCVEIKQTMRFGLPSGQVPANLIVHGPGASIPHIAPAISEVVDMHVRAEVATESAAAVNAFVPGSIEHVYATAPRTGLDLVPGAAEEQISGRGIRRALAVGTAVAMLAVAGEFMYNKVETRRFDPVFDHLSPTMASVVRERDQRDEARSLALGAGRAALVIRTASGPEIPWTELLAALPGLVDNSLRIDSIDAQSDASRAIVSLAGTVSSANDAEASASLTTFVKRLEELPMVSDANLGTTQRESAPDGMSSKKFSITLRLHDAQSDRNQLASYGATRAADGEENQ